MAFYLCRDILENLSGTEIFRSYRSHYTKHKYENSNEFKGKRGHYKVKQKTLV